MSDFEPIPTPFRHHWRRVRMHVFPILMFAITAGSVVVLWNREVAPPGMAGEVKAVMSSVTAPEAGRVQALHVHPFQKVQQGDVIGYFAIVSDERVEAETAVIEAEIALTKAGAIDPVLGHQRNLLEWHGLHQDYLDARAYLAGLRVRVRQAEREYERVRGLTERNQFPTIEHDRIEAEFQALRAEEAEVVASVQALERALEQMRTHSDLQSSDTGIEAALDWHRKRIAQVEAEFGAIELRAPISGVVTLIHRNAGDLVPRGEPILEIRSEHADYIVGYMREPLMVQPREGMKVEVALRGMNRARAEAQILGVGPQFEPLGLAFLRPYDQLEERALPLMISLPRDLPLRPGELVDLRLIATD